MFFKASRAGHIGTLCYSFADSSPTLNARVNGLNGERTSAPARARARARAYEYGGAPGDIFGLRPRAAILEYVATRECSLRAVRSYNDQLSASVRIFVRCSIYGGAIERTG